MQKSKKPALNAKQARFVTEYLKDLNATQAAVRAGYSVPTAKQQGSRLLTHVDVAKAIASAQQRVAKKAEITVESLTAELEEARALALKSKQASAAVAASMGKGKLTGLLVERHRHSGAIGTYDLSKLSDEQFQQLEPILQQLEAILGASADDGGLAGGEGKAGG